MFQLAVFDGKDIGTDQGTSGDLKRAAEQGWMQTIVLVRQKGKLKVDTVSPNS